MKTIKLLFLNVLTLFIVTSCTIKQTINYNEDMSGNNEIIIDYGDFLEQMSGLMGDSSSLDKDMDLKEGLGDLEDTFQDIEGISNLNTIQKAKEGLVGFSFDFKDTKSLNEAMSGYLSEETGKQKKASKSYVQKKKKLILNFDEQDLGSMEESLGDESMMMMMASFDYEFTVNFPFPIKSVDNKMYTLSSDRKSISTSVNLGDYLDGKESLSTKVKW